MSLHCEILCMPLFHWRFRNSHKLTTYSAGTAKMILRKHVSVDESDTLRRITRPLNVTLFPNFGIFIKSHHLLCVTGQRCRCHDDASARCHGDARLKAQSASVWSTDIARLSVDDAITAVKPTRKARSLWDAVVLWSAVRARHQVPSRRRQRREGTRDEKSNDCRINYCCCSARTSRCLSLVEISNDDNNNNKCARLRRRTF